MSEGVSEGVTQRNMNSLFHPTTHFPFHSHAKTLPSSPPSSSSSSFPPKSNHNRYPRLRCSIEIDMVKNNQGIYTPKHHKVVVLWDLDNKPPRGPPYDAAVSLKTLAQRFGDLVDFSAYANRHAFIHLPQWVLHERRERRNLDILERKGIVAPSDAYTCGVCGRKCKTNMDLKKHFKQLHQRERQKKLNRLKQLKGKKRNRFRERFLRGDHKYNEAARTLVAPKVGYGLASELRRAGVFVKMVEDKPQAADWALKRQMVHSMSRGIDWLFLVSDDSDFSDMLRRAGEANLRTVVVGDSDGALGRHADLWVPWLGVENGEIGEDDLVLPNERDTRTTMQGLGDEEEDEEFEHDFMFVFSEDGDEDGEEDDYEEDQEQGDEGVHWGIQNGLNLSRGTVMYFKHNYMNSLRETLENIISKNKRATKLRRYIIIEAVYQEIDELCDEWVPEPFIPSLNKEPQYEPPVLESAAGPHTIINGKEVINFASANYLGFIGHQKLLDSCSSALEKYGAGSCGPRGFYGTIDVHLDFEARIAKFLGTPDSILYSYGLSTMFSAIPAFS